MDTLIDLIFITTRIKRNTTLRVSDQLRAHSTVETAHTSILCVYSESAYKAANYQCSLGVSVVVGTSNSSVTLSNKGMSHYFRISVSISQGQLQ